MIWLMFMVMMGPDGEIVEINTYHWEQFSTLEKCNENIAKEFADTPEIDTAKKTLSVNSQNSYVLTVTFDDDESKLQLLCSQNYADKKAKQRGDEELQRLVDETLGKND